MDTFAQYTDLDYCYLTTIGRVSGRPHEIEIWFALHGSTLYLLAGSRENADWVKNLQRTPRVTVRLNTETFGGMARIVENSEEDALARQLVVGKYTPRDGDLSEWGRTALPVAVELETGDGPTG